MTNARREIQTILDTWGVFVVSDRPRLARTAQRMAAEGSLRSVARGVFARWEHTTHPVVRARAAQAWIADGVLTGRAAAQLTFWPELAVPVVTVSSPRSHRARRGFAVKREHLAPELVTAVDGVRVTVPALTALDLCLELGGDGIDQALRLRRTTLDAMAEALRLTPGRIGNRVRREFLRDSRDEPWSAAERQAHRLLRGAGVTGWRGNLPVRCGSNQYYLDVGFESLRLGVEIDGFEVHRADNVSQFVHDRRKWSHLHNLGWGLLHFAAVDVFDKPEAFLATVDAAVRLRRR